MSAEDAPRGDRDGRNALFEARLTRRRLLANSALVGGAWALGSVVGACGTSGGTSASPTASAEVPKKGGTLKAAIVAGGGKDTLDAQVVTNEPMIANSFQLYNRLVEYTPDYKLVNVLADEVSANADARVWTVRLKPDVLFSDGRPVTADDVVFSYNRIIDPKDPKSGATSLAMLKPSGIKKLDDRTVQFTLETANSIFPESLAYRENAIVPTDYDPKSPIGTGPFVVTDFTPGQQTKFVPNANYFGEGPYVDELTILQFADPTARINALISGAVDHCDQVSGPQIDIIKGRAGYSTWQTKSGGWQPFTMRIDQKPFSDVRVRQALRLIVDRQQMLEQAYGGYGWMGNDMYAPFDPGYPKDLPQRQQDLEKAKSLLKQAGYPNLTAQLVTSTAVGAGGVEMAQVIAQQAKGAGVNITVNKVDPGVFYGDEYLKWLFAVDFWGTRNYLLQTTQGTLPTAPYNETHWKNAKWQALVEEAFRTVDDTKRNELVTEASTIEYNEGGYIIWAFNILIDGYSDKLGGLVHDVFLNSAMGFRYSLVYFK